MDENKLLEAIRQIVKEEVSQTVEAKLDKKLDEKLEPIKADIGELTAEVAEIREDVRHARVLIEAHDEKLQLLYEAQAETAAKFGQLDRMEKTLNDVKSEAGVIRDIVRFHSSDIATLKKAAL